MLIGGEPGLAEDFASSLLGPLDELPDDQRERSRETLVAWVRHGGRAPAMAAALHLHAQSVRYRVRRLVELLGDLEDPDRRFEVELATRCRGWI